MPSIKFLPLCWLMIVGLAFAQDAPPAEFIRVAPDRKGFVRGTTNAPFVAIGVNYDHDPAGRLLEDYWETEWETVAADFAEIKELGANVVRIHLQFGKFMESKERSRASALQRLEKLLQLAERHQLALDVTGLGCYHKQDVPAWYDELSENERWDAQAKFWEAVAGVCAKSPAVFCYDLMNEPVAPGGTKKGTDWLGPAFGGKHFVQWISREAQGRPRHEVAKAWIARLVKAIRNVDRAHLITVGLVDWSLNRPGLQSGFVPELVTAELDFVCVHLYPEAGKVDEALKTLDGFCLDKPVVIEETFPLKCSLAEMEDFLDRARPKTASVISFYWGKTIAEYRQSAGLIDAIVADWLEAFQKRARAQNK